MATEILLYSAIYPDTAAKFLADLEANKHNAPCVRVNCPGGDPYSTYGMIAKACEVDADYMVDGQASSCGFYLVANAGANKVKCLDISSFIAHRAATWMEKYPELMTDAIKAELATINGSLRAIIETNLPNFEKVTGVKLDKMFSMDSRIDVKINAKQAEKMGLVGKVIKLTPDRKKEITALAAQYRIAAFAEGTDLNINSNNDNMEYKTLAELRAAFPLLIAEAETASAVKALEKEKIRIAAWMQYNIVDAKAVKEGIESGKDVDISVMASMQVKMAGPAFLEAMKAQNTTTVTPAAAATKTAKELEIEAFHAAAKAQREKKNPVIA